MSAILRALRFRCCKPLIFAQCRERALRSKPAHPFPRAMIDSVTVAAAARLHLGFLDMNGGLGRRFGGLGLAIDRPATRLTIRRSAAPAVEGLEAERAGRHLALLARHLGLTHSYSLTVHEAI